MVGGRRKRTPRRLRPDRPGVVAIGLVRTGVRTYEVPQVVEGMDRSGAADLADLIPVWTMGEM